jgi:hypothetical protein
MRVGDLVRHEVTGALVYAIGDWGVVAGHDGWARSMRLDDVQRGEDGRWWLVGRVVYVAEHTVSFQTEGDEPAVYTCRTEKAEPVVA